MALVCDYCGDVTESTKRVSVAFGHNQEIALKGATAREWFYYCEGDCADAVKAMLDNIRLFAMHGEGSGLVWQLVEQAVAPVAEGVKPAGAPEPEPIGESKFEERERQKDESAKAGESDEAMERKGNLNLTWWLQRQVAIPVTELRSRQAAGTSIVRVVTRSKSQGNLHSAGIATLEDAAAMTMILGLPGVGPKILKQVEVAMAKQGLSFKPGPDLERLGLTVRDCREDAGIEVEDLAVIVATSLGAPENRGGVNHEMKSKAVSSAEQLLRDFERGVEGVAPPILDALGEALDITRPGMLAKAMELEAL